MALIGGTASYTGASDTDMDVKIGQMLLVGFRGAEATPDLRILEDIRTHHLGGVVLFDQDVTTGGAARNIRSPDQLAALIRGLQTAAAIPLLVAVDQEGGQIDRLKKRLGFPSTVSAQYLGRQDNTALTRRHATMIAQTLAAAGITLNLAPVVDLNRNPHNPIIGRRRRSFSPDSDVVTKHAAAFIDAHHAHGILTCLKHFPGHGSSATDTHHQGVFPCL